jgi:hypothetical protein
MYLSQTASPKFRISLFMTSAQSNSLQYDPIQYENAPHGRGVDVLRMAAHPATGI